jgi:hypothetical protein
MAQVVCSLCSCRLEWNDVDPDELQCGVCGHSLDDDHAASTATSTVPNDPDDHGHSAFFRERKVI